ncbi:MAG: cyclic nucleotide-binding domain-containing protein [Deltaproteobacteria bacterium]|nr:MAG: cyclic nucleotide-binding domain-containing protein [Deltaproteobacteria bacterium]
MSPEEVIKKTFIFENLDEQEVAAILKITKEKRFSKGEIIMQEGHEGDTMYIVVNGSIEVSKTLTMKVGEERTEREKILRRFKAEDNVVFGEMAMIDRGNRSASAASSTDCTLLEIKRTDFLDLIEKRPQTGVKILRRIAELLACRLRQSSQDVIRLTTALSIALSS